MKPAKTINLTTDAEWHTVYDALSQFVDNTRQYVAELENPAEEDQLAVLQLETAERLLESFDADLANLAMEPV